MLQQFIGYRGLQDIQGEQWLILELGLGIMSRHRLGKPIDGEHAVFFWVWDDQIW